MTTLSPVVVLRCDAGGDYGLGHAMRCLTLARAFQARGGAVHFVVQPGSPEGQAFIAEEGMLVDVSPAHAGDAEDAVFVAEILRARPKPTVLVLDSRDLSEADGAAYRGTALTLVIDDQPPRSIPSDILLNYNPWIRFADYRPVESSVLLLGLDYNLVAADYFRSSGVPSSNDFSVLLTMGGHDPKNDTLRIIETCADLLVRHPVDVVIGPSHPDAESVARAAERCLPHGRLHRSPKGLAPLIAAAGAVITAGGTTCYEIMAARVPMAALPVEPHQVPLVDNLAGVGALLRLDNAARRIDCAVVAALLQDVAARKRQIGAQEALIEAPGAPRVVDRVCNVLGMR